LLIHALVLACCLGPVFNHPVRFGAINLGLAVADYESALRVQPPCHETNPLFGVGHPSRATFYSRGLPVDFAIESFGWILERRIPRHNKTQRIWKLPFAAISYAHISGIQSNLTCR